MTTIRPAVAGARPRGVPVLPATTAPAPDLQSSTVPPTAAPLAAVGDPSSTLHSRASHVSRSALPSRPDLGGIHHSPDAAQAGAARQQLEDFLVRSRLRDITICTDLNGAAPGCRASLAPAFAAQHLPITTPPAWRDRWAWTAAPTKPRWARDPAGHAGQPGPSPSRPCPSWSPPSASAAASSRPRARPPWPSTPSTPSAPRAIGPTTKNAASPSCPAARSSKACAAPPARASGQLRLLLLPRSTSRCWASPRSLSRPIRAGARPAAPVETRAVMSGRFHDTFLHEYGSLAEPAATLLRAGRPALVPQSGLRFVRRGRL